MRAWGIIFLLAGVLLGSGQAQGQNLGNRRCQWVKLQAGAIVLDSLTVAENTIEILDRRQIRRPLSFHYDPTTNLFQFIGLTAPETIPVQRPDSIVRDSSGAFLPRFRENKPQIDSVLVCYRVLPLNVAQPSFKRDIRTWDSTSFERAYGYNPPAPREEIFKTPGLNKTGSVSRGVSVGNTQNVFVNSALNLQLEGKLTDEISITASITDQNIPFQPEGNTQQLQEFDRVFITLQHRLWTLTGGDVVLRNRPTSHFLRFYKNVQGGALEVNRGKPGWESATSVAASVAKGKFASENVTPIESVQGPYRLRGPNGERFIIVLANSERVYLDGKLLQRGFDYDYVIDYNQAEITFTPKWIITRNSRIRVDFEYSDLNYTRSVVHASHYQKMGKFNVYGNFYNEADNPGNPLILNLSNEEKRLLSQIGDRLDLAAAPSGDSVRFDRNQVLYLKKDTVTASGAAFSIFQYSTDSTLAHYAVSFTELPSGGNYVLQNNTVNGRVFQWVEPVNGVPQGRYEPVRILPTPIQKQMMTLGGIWSLDEKSNVFVEVAGSKNDLNRFSSLDAGDDQGKAVRVGYQVNDRPVKFLGDYKLRSALTYEFTDPNFVPIDRYRDVEFDRDWSSPTNTTLARQSRVEDHIFTFSVGGVKDPLHFVNYRISRRYRPSEVDGTQHFLEMTQQVKGLELRGNLFLLKNEQVESTSDWVRGELNLQYPTRFFTPGYTYRFDKNRITSNQSEALLGSANYFDDHLFYLESRDTASFKYRAEYSRRVDFRPENGELGNKQTSNTFNFSTSTVIKKNHQLTALITLRNLQACDSLTETTVLSKIDWRGDFLDRHLRSELSYAIGNGRELKREYLFVETIPGQGTHFFEDLNQDGRQDLNEFFESQPADPPYRRNFVRLFIPTDEYVLAYTNQFTYRLNSSLPREWQNSEARWKRIVSKFSALSFITLDKRTTDDDLRSRFNPFSLNFADSSLLSLTRSYRNTLYFNRSNPKYGIEWTVQQGLQKTLLTNGTDVRNNASQQMLVRVNLTEVFSSRLNVTRAKRESGSNYLTTKNFLIRSWEVMPELSYQPNPTIRFTGTYQWMNKENELGNQEKALFHELGTETRLSQVGKRTVTGIVKYIKINYTGLDTSPVAFEMLNGFRAGNNLTWNLALQQRLSSGLNITLDYDGRKPQGIRTIHTGRMQVSVLF
ncbi:hypothetical protein ACD591_03255 [Rufibacter glacialis]|uniref:Uncharacterized protein n=1 Tax=Rufibacter glacialis TaxID=1259555 RepID=A0A5M8QL67_9BACT|nr:hypothetical protein [Rufibacter glacialis]KAA6435891.1 hypothetical protein FOE74_08150 [Rufibacter glacialis]GGK67439.1 hypothetical protein GCM10011405_14300 [Rufibacter glacialis]